MGDFVSIGEVSRACGLSVSALRFYDQEGLLTPAWVDPATGYRWYAESQVELASLVAVLRRIGLPIPEVATVIAHRDEPELVGRVLSEHLERLEQGLVAARSEIAGLQARWGLGPGSPDEMVIDAADLGRALACVRFAISRDEDRPELHGVLLEVGEQALRLTATDRFRAAFCEIPIVSGAGTFRVVIGTDELERAEAFLAAATGGVVVEADGLVVTFRSGDEAVQVATAPVEFPDLSQVLARPTVAQSLVDRERLIEKLDRASPESSRWLEATSSGEVAVLAEGTGLGENALRFQREFLYEAVSSLPGTQLQLELGPRATPLAIRSVDDPGAYSVLMPIRRS